MNYINAGENEAGTLDFDYSKLSDEEAETVREDMVQTKSFFILPSQLFCNVLQRAVTDQNLKKTLEGSAVLFCEAHELRCAHAVGPPPGEHY